MLSALVELLRRWERWVMGESGERCPTCGDVIPDGLEEDHECE